MSDSNVENLLRNVFLSAAYIVTSGAMILYNAKILKEVHPYPALLTTGHMVCSGGLSVALVKLGPEYLPSFLPADFVALARAEMVHRRFQMTTPRDAAALN